MADVASDVGPVGAYEDMASWVTVAPEKAGKQYLLAKGSATVIGIQCIMKQAWLSVPACRGKLEKLKF